MFILRINNDDFVNDLQKQIHQTKKRFFGDVEPKEVIIYKVDNVPSSNLQVCACLCYP